MKKRRRSRGVEVYAILCLLLAEGVVLMTIAAIGTILAPLAVAGEVEEGSTFWVTLVMFLIVRGLWLARGWTIRGRFGKAQ